MQKLDLKQNTPEWEEFRRLKIGASDAPIICGISPHKNKYSLWKEKALGHKSYKTSAMKRGSELEDEAKESLESQIGISFDKVCGIHDSIPYMMSSFDGYSEKEKCLLEIKCPNLKTYEEVENGNIPSHYLYQINHQLEVSGFDHGILFVYNGKTGVIKDVRRNSSIIQEIVEKEEQFWNSIINFEPPEDTHRLRDDAIWQNLAENFLLAKDQHDTAKAYLDACRKSLIDACDDASCKGHGVTVSKCTRKGTVQYQRIPELKGVDLELYRKAPEEYWKVG